MDDFADEFETVHLFVAVERQQDQSTLLIYQYLRVVYTVN